MYIACVTQPIIIKPLTHYLLNYSRLGTMLEHFFKFHKFLSVQPEALINYLFGSMTFNTRLHASEL